MAKIEGESEANMPLPSLDILTLHEESVLRVLDIGLRREVERVGFQRVILGLSGGLDSALSAALAVRCFGPEKVRLVGMPYRSSHPDSEGHARLLADQLGVPLLIEEITDSVDAYFQRHPKADAGRRGNKMARERMSILYDLSVAENALVLGTSNKTEILLGYSTLFGDSASAVNPIGDLYKTQVRQIARALDLPEVILTKPPSADLWEGQTDEKELGFTYEEVDLLLYYMVDHRSRDARLLELGFDAAFVGDVRQRMRRNQFKRKMPVILKLSSRTIDKDFLYPRDWTG
jgi:NAD+ synthase